MGFFGSLIGVVVKTALTPVAIVKDVVNIATDEESNSTSNHIDSITNDIEDIFEI